MPQRTPGAWAGPGSRHSRRHRHRRTGVFWCDFGTKGTGAEERCMQGLTHLLRHLADFYYPSGLHLKTTSSRQAALTSQTRWALPPRLHSPSLNLTALCTLRIFSSSIYNTLFNINLPCWPGRPMSVGSMRVLCTVLPVPGAGGHPAILCWQLH